MHAPARCAASGALASLLFLLTAMFPVRAQAGHGQPQEQEKDAPRYDWIFLYNRETGAMQPLPLEKVQQAAKQDGPQAWLEGPRSALRLPKDRQLVFVVAYSYGLPPQWAARAYRLRVEDGRRLVRLDARKMAPNGEILEGRLPVKMQKHGRISMRLLLPWPLPPGEYAISTPAGTRAFTFGIDP